jgi:hypothetical protein
MRIMIFFPTFLTRLTKKVMIYYIFGNIQEIKILFHFLQKDPEEGASLAEAVAHTVSRLGLA